MPGGERTQVQIRAVCQGCGRITSRMARKGYTWKCKDCGRVNPGPAMIENLTKELEAGARARVQRRSAKAANRPAAPAPVRRKPRAKPIAAASDGGAPATAAPPAPAPPPPPKREQGILDRIWFGAD